MLRRDCCNAGAEPWLRDRGLEQPARCCLVDEAATRSSSRRCGLARLRSIWLLHNSAIANARKGQLHGLARRTPQSRQLEAWRRCCLTTRWSGPWTIVGRTLVANRLLAGFACGKRQRGRPLNSAVRSHDDGDMPQLWKERRRDTCESLVVRGHSREVSRVREAFVYPQSTRNRVGESGLLCRSSYGHRVRGHRCIVAPRRRWSSSPRNCGLRIHGVLSRAHGPDSGSRCVHCTAHRASWPHHLGCRRNRGRCGVVGRPCDLTMRWSGPWTIVGRTLIANSCWLALHAASGSVAGRSTRSLASDKRAAYNY